MAAATMTNSWAHAVPLDETTGYPPPPRAESMRSSDSRPTSQHRRLSARRRSDFHLPSDAEPAAAVRASSRASNMRKRSRNALREEDGSNSSKQHPRSRAEESAWIHRDKLAEIEIREMEEAGIHVRQSRRSESRGPADRRQERGSSRSMSRSELYRRGSRDGGEEREDGGEEGEEPTLSPHYASFDEFSRRKRVSTIPAVEDEEEAEAEEDADKHRPFDHNLDSDFRTPEEIEAERAAHRQRITRPSTSRLPVSKVSPVPVPQTVIGRDSPLPRSRNGSGAWSGHWDDQHYARRARSGSVGSQVMLDDPAADTAATTHPTYSSSSRPTSSHLHGSANETSHPRKARVPTKPLPTSGGSRKVSNTTTTAPSSGAGAGTSRPGSSSTKPRQLSTSTNRGARPASSHKKTSPSPGRRPSTSHNNNRPEGEAPWIASMYKPDPRLPQDQQMLPTHAKRMMLAQQQQQQQEQAKAGGAASEEAKGAGGGGATGGGGGGGRPPPAGAMWINEKGKWTDSEPSSSSRPNQQKGGSGKAGTAGVGGGGDGGTWPLSPPGGNSQTSPPKSPGSGAGGYRITPTISPPAQIISRKNSGKDETNGFPIPDASDGGGGGGGGGGEHSTQQPSQYPQQQRYQEGEGEEEEEKGSDPNSPNPNATPLNATPRISPPPRGGAAAGASNVSGFAGTGNTATVTAGRGGRGVGTGEKEAEEEEGSMKKQKGKGGCLGCCVVM
ncbi:hypothetical protein KC340_g18500 [Hortaea werneckii]|nr:hypothetical protein KC342_g6199 [Hortaea werneckii]KAI7202545.1 hypothetical protein KC365_g18468 [Hortaea werneckii]KAI7284092.1 hypothetical protein KC340_g18500 [Hortaea werneckii]KAI7392338.1 hypothetical protein KC328_g7097 [Hortaea werneckii]